jgi:hypothetical protein
MEIGAAVGVFLLVVLPVVGASLPWLFDQLEADTEPSEPPETNQIGRTIPGGEYRTNK